MTRFAPHLLLTLLLVGCGDERGKGACSVECSGETPYCDADADRCVPCLEDVHCEVGSICVTTSGGAVCGECRTEADCGGGHCVEGACIECTVATEAADCGDFACDPIAHECTERERDSLYPLDACRADSECFGEDAACVPTFFQGEPDGTHCLRASPNCQRPLMMVTDERVSVSWAAPATYCGFNENVVSAQAVRSMVLGLQCESEDDTETCGPGGLCRLLNSSPSHKCTIPCGSSDSCPDEGGIVGCNTIAGFCGTPG